MAQISFIVRDITGMDVDAIVCPAHKHLVRGRGLSGQVFDKAGEELVLACAEQSKSEIGEARITPGFNLPARFIIHAVTPYWSSGDGYGTDALKQLAACYENSLELARRHQLERIAIPALGAGNNRVPLTLSARKGLDACQRYAGDFAEIFICCPRVSSRATWIEVYNRFIAPQAPLGEDEDTAQLIPRG